MIFYGLNVNQRFPRIMAINKRRTGRNVNVVRIAASTFFLRAYAIHDAMANARGQSGYAQTEITKFQAS
jgi:hypothetical protein